VRETLDDVSRFDEAWNGGNCGFAAAYGVLLDEGRGDNAGYATADDEDHAGLGRGLPR
jgi:hypothetical protein